MFFWNKICGLVVVFLILTIPSFSQKSIPAHLNESIFFAKNTATHSDSIYLIPSNIFLNKIANLEQTIPANFTTTNYGFFCKNELAVEKAIKIPLRIRLGSLQQCNYYEGKK
jgi:hypothetical protein